MLSGRARIVFDVWISSRWPADDAGGRARLTSWVEWNELSMTVRTRFREAEKGRCLHPQFVRVADSKRAMPAIPRAVKASPDLPSDARCGGRNGIAHQIGNAVRAPLAAHLDWWVETMVEDDLPVAHAMLMSA